jgi:glutaredoxin 3
MPPAPASTSPEVTVYTTASCGYCRRAKALLAMRGIPFREVDVTGDDEAREELAERAEGRRTVPVIFFGSEPIGGYDDLARLDRQGRLAERLAAVRT